MKMFPENPSRPGTKTHQLYEILKEQRAVTLREIHRTGNDTARLRCEIKTYLRAHGLDIECIKEPPDNPLYRVVGPGI
jgi:hypothetical protein